MKAPLLIDQLKTLAYVASPRRTFILMPQIQKRNDTESVVALNIKPCRQQSAVYFDVSLGTRLLSAEKKGNLCQELCHFIRGVEQEC
jgi:hypothetical protein